MGPAPGPSYLDTDHGHDWSRTTGEAAAHNLLAVARAGGAADPAAAVLSARSRRPGRSPIPL